MELKVTTLEGKAAGSVNLSDEIFGLEPRQDIIARCVQWQLNQRQAGTHKAKDRAEIWRTGKKMYKQKGTGGARHGSARVPQFRGGGRAFGPVVRSHGTDLPKKVRALALRRVAPERIGASRLRRGTDAPRARLPRNFESAARQCSPRVRYGALRH